MIIQGKNISKAFSKKNIISDLSFTVENNSIIGLVGANGSGKSTIMKLLSGYLYPDSGKINILGYDIKDHPEEVHSSIFYLPETNPLYLHMYVKEYLKFIGTLYNIEAKTLEEKIKQVCSRLQIKNLLYKKINTLSKGYRQRVGIAQCLIVDPRILLLDEPTNGLDRETLIDFYTILKKLSEDKVIILSSHLYQEIELLSDRIIVLKEGKILSDKVRNAS